MGTYTQIIYQIVFGTYKHERTMSKDTRDLLHKYITGILQKKNCFPYQVNGVEDHLHIITSIHPSVSLSSLVKDIKLASSKKIKDDGLFKNFNGWQEGYGAFTYTVKERYNLIEYVKNQEKHHQKKSFTEEYVELLKENGVDYDEKFL